MRWTEFVPEFVLLALIILLRSPDPNAAALVIRGVLIGALVGAAWCSLRTLLGRTDLSKLKLALFGVGGALPMALAYAAFGADFFTAAGWDQFLFRDRLIGPPVTQEERDITLLAMFGATVVLLTMNILGEETRGDLP